MYTLLITPEQTRKILADIKQIYLLDMLNYNTQFAQKAITKMMRTQKIDDFDEFYRFVMVDDGFITRSVPRKTISSDDGAAPIAKAVAVRQNKISKEYPHFLSLDIPEKACLSIIPYFTAKSKSGILILISSPLLS